MDLDHTERYVPMDYGGPPGQTRLGNLGPMARPGHRAVTHGGWQKHQPEPGYYVHRSPIGYIYLVTNQGTLALGRTALQRCRLGSIKAETLPKTSAKNAREPRGRR